MFRSVLSYITLFFSILMSFNGSAEPSDVDLRAEAQRCAAAMFAFNASEAVACIHPRIVEAVGGVDGLKASLDRQRKEFADQGVAIESVLIGTPGASVTLNDREFVLVPQTVRMRVPQGVLRQPGYLLAIREPGSKSWTFVDTVAASPKSLSALFPSTPASEFEAKLKIPPRERPTLETQ